MLVDFLELPSETVAKANTATMKHINPRNIYVSKAR